MNGILLIDKPQGWTSMDVCAKLRGALGEKRVGHSGTLDPMATGLLVVFLGRATRAVEFAEADEKTYEAELRLGMVTDTQDITGTILDRREVHISVAELDSVFAKFLGEQEQLPPMYSAVKVNGKPLYQIARKGGSVERKRRKITIFELRRINNDLENVKFTVRCSKGTYVRTLCNDIGAALGCGGTMSALRRTAAGPFLLNDAHTLEQILEAAEGGTLRDWLLPVETLFPFAKTVSLSVGQEKVVRNGGSYTCRLPEGKYLLFSQTGEFLALAQLFRGTMQQIKSFFEV